MSKDLSQYHGVRLWLMQSGAGKQPEVVNQKKFEGCGGWPFPNAHSVDGDIISAAAPSRKRYRCFHQRISGCVLQGLSI